MKAALLQVNSLDCPHCTWTSHSLFKTFRCSHKQEERKFWGFTTHLSYNNLVRCVELVNMNEAFWMLKTTSSFPCLEELDLRTSLCVEVGQWGNVVINGDFLFCFLVLLKWSYFVGHFPGLVREWIVSYDDQGNLIHPYLIPSIVRFEKTRNSVSRLSTFFIFIISALSELSYPYGPNLGQFHYQPLSPADLYGGRAEPLRWDESFDWDSFLLVQVELLRRRLPCSPEWRSN